MIEMTLSEADFADVLGFFRMAAHFSPPWIQQDNLREVGACASACTESAREADRTTHAANPERPGSIDGSTRSLP